MNAQELLESVEALLGFRVTERQNDAVLIRPTRETEPGTFRQSVRPATREEVMMFLRILGLTSTLNEATAAIALLTGKAAETTVALNKAADRIEAITKANHEIGKERDSYRLGAEGWLAKCAEADARTKAAEERAAAQEDRAERLEEACDDLYKKLEDASREAKS